MMSIAFIGLGNMGLPMAGNLMKAGHRVIGFDVAEPCRAAAQAAGIEVTDAVATAVSAADAVVSMLPAGTHVRAVYGGETGVIRSVRPNTLLIDCSTIDVESARAVNSAATEAGLDMVDAPVSGGVGGAAAGTLTFMVGGSAVAFDRARPLLEAMGKAVIHAGPSGNGQAAKICNNMILGISMIAVSEAFVLAEKLGLDARKLFEISSQSSGQCWSMTSYCPAPGPVPNSPANREYEPGFTAAMMLKDLRLAQQAASETGAATPLGAEAAALYTLFCNAGRGGVDFSGIIKMLSGK